MPEPILFEYAVMRIVPRVEREEFINAGVLLFSAKQKFLGMRYQLDEARLNAFAPKLDVAEIRNYLEAFEDICKGGDAGGPIGKFPVAERFRWLSATRSTVVQTSKVHPGFCDDPRMMLDRLFRQLVL